MIKHLHPDTQMTLLAIYDNIWADGHIPDSWKEAIVLPILKQCKYPSSVTRYHTVALKSCLSKMFEKMINRRLLYHLESNSLLDTYQCSFRAGRSTIDHFVRVKTYIRNAFVHKNTSSQFFLTLKKRAIRSGTMEFFVISPQWMLAGTCLKLLRVTHQTINFMSGLVTRFYDHSIKKLGYHKVVYLAVPFLV